MEPEGLDYSSWSPQKLIERVTTLEAQLRQLNSTHASPITKTPRLDVRLKPKATRSARSFDASKYSTRFIALKFAYLGQRYNGFEHHANNKTPLRTIEDVLWHALRKAHLIFPTGNCGEGPDQVSWEGCDYSKCGRTDRGVSAFGQVIGIRVRSNCRPGAKEGSNHSDGRQGGVALVDSSPTEDLGGQENFAFDSIKDELPYVRILNRILPPDIRVLAWCPSPPEDFSARFSCRERQYRYFFTQPAFIPTRQGAHQRREGWLDIGAMKEAAKMFQGSHDFRNFCKVDASKQIDVFTRDIFRADIVKIEAESEPASFISRPPFSHHDGPKSPVPQVDRDTEQTVPATYALILHGSGFLWHQVRHMMAILFLVGQGLESPSLIAQLLNTTANPKKPMYEMADDAPLVLWDCIFPRKGQGRHTDALEWIYSGEENEEGGSGSGSGSGSKTPVKGSDKFGFGGIVDNLWTEWRQRKMAELLAGMLLNLAATDHSTKTSFPPHNRHSHPADTSTDHESPFPPLSSNNNNNNNKTMITTTTNSQKVFAGGDTFRLAGKYVPILQRRRMEEVDVVNRRYALRKGFEMNEEIRHLGFRSVRAGGLSVGKGTGGDGGA